MTSTIFQFTKAIFALAVFLIIIITPAFVPTIQSSAQSWNPFDTKCKFKYNRSLPEQGSGNSTYGVLFLDKDNKAVNVTSKTDPNRLRNADIRSCDDKGARVVDFSTFDSYIISNNFSHINYKDNISQDVLDYRTENNINKGYYRPDPNKFQVFKEKLRRDIDSKLPPSEWETTKDSIKESKTKPNPTPAEIITPTLAPTPSTNPFVAAIPKPSTTPILSKPEPKQDAAPTITPKTSFSNPVSITKNRSPFENSDKVSVPKLVESKPKNIRPATVVSSDNPKQIKLATSSNSRTVSPQASIATKTISTTSKKYIKPATVVSSTNPKTAQKQSSVPGSRTIPKSKPYTKPSSNAQNIRPATVVKSTKSIPSTPKTTSKKTIRPATVV